MVTSNSSKTHSSRSSILVVSLLSLIIVCTCFFNWVLLSRYRDAHRSNLDLIRLSESLSATNNLLVSATYNVPTNDYLSVSNAVVPTVLVLVPGFGTYLDLHGRYIAIIGGLEYRVGDITQWGPIFAISDGRCYCRDSQQLSILRWCPIPPSDEVPSSPEGGIGKFEAVDI